MKKYRERLGFAGASLAAKNAAKDAPAITLYNGPNYFSLWIEPLFYAQE
jgi:hypothetical protein